MASTYQTLQCFLDPRQQVRVFLHVGIEVSRSLYRNVDLHLSFEPTPQHFTMHSGWGKLHLNPTFLAGTYELLSTNGSEDLPKSVL